MYNIANHNYSRFFNSIQLKENQNLNLKEGE
jgi:hypothetical protein